MAYHGVRRCWAAEKRPGERLLYNAALVSKGRRFDIMLYNIKEIGILK